jgi:hypothetical protein
MKKFLPFLSIALFTAIVFSACSNKPDADAQAAAALQQQQNSVNPDTVGLSQFQAWKAQNELADVEEFKQPEQYAAAPVVKKTKPVYKAPAPKAPIKKAPVPTAPEALPNTSSETVDNVSNGSGDVASSESAGEAKAPAKKGISKAAKGAVIGGVVGALGGAIINKDNRVVGAGIGGVLGAGGWYGVGRGMDKKDGRYLSS